jgi:hypothetical protein
LSKLHGFSILGLVALVCLLLCGEAEAATVVVGSPLSGEFTSGVSTSGFFSAIANTSLGEAGAHVTSPVSGTVVRWRTKGTFAGGGFRIHVLRPNGAGGYVGAAASSFQTPVGAALQTFPTDLPIQAGDMIGLDAEGKTTTYSEGAGVGSVYTIFSPFFSEGASSSAIASNTGEVGFDAEVVPTPALIVIGPATGPLPGGTTVTIAGRDLEGTTAVRFGPNAASANFTVVSDNEITAVSPPGAEPGSVDVTVTTPGGTSAPVAGDRFTYAAPAGPQTVITPPPAPAPPTCTVPGVVGMHLEKVRKRVLGAGCRLGTVKKAKGATAKTGRVVRQSPKPGAQVAAGTRVSVKLGRGRS